MRTSKKFIVQGVTFDMDHKLQFMLRSVPFGQHEAYQKWFQKTYLSSLSSVTLRADLIRFVCMCIIPTNEILQSQGSTFLLQSLFQVVTFPAIPLYLKHRNKTFYVKVAFVQIILHKRRCLQMIHFSDESFIFFNFIYQVYF